MNQAPARGAGDPLHPKGAKLFIIDARHGVERRHLLDWLYGTWGEVGREQTAVLSLSASGKGPDLRPLAARLDAVGEDKPLRLRDLLFGDPRQPGALRARLILLRDRRRAQCLRGEPATVGALRERFARRGGDADDASAAAGRPLALAFAGWVAQQATLTLDVEERGLRGARYKVPRLLADHIATGARFRCEMAELAAERKRPLPELTHEARQYMKELIATPSALFLDLRARLDRFILTQGYDQGFRTDPAEIEALRETMRSKPTVLLFTHKTYLDGLTPNALAYENDLTMLHTFGGINLDYAGFGTLMRRSGTIYIRRTFKDLPVYKLVLRQYIAYLLEKRFPMSWAIEGTRSRLGKLMQPRYGILKYVLDAAHHGGIEDLHIVPFVTSFDLIRDVEEYAAEQTGRVKRPESLSWMIGYLRSLREPMGRLRIDIGAPVVLPVAPDPEDRLALARVAFDVAVGANRVMPLTVTSVMCTVLLGTAPRGATGDELAHVTRHLADWARARGIRLSDELQTLDHDAIRAIADKLVHSGLILRHEAGRETVYTIEPSKHAMASYYRNSVIHHFLDKTLIELALFRLDEQDGAEGAEGAEGADAPARFWVEVEGLRDLFKFEFFYPPRELFRRDIEAELERTDARWAAQLQAGPKGIRSLIRHLQPLFGHAALLPFVEAYLVVFEQLARLKDGESLGESACVEQCLVEGRQAYLLRRISSEASIGKILFENGWKLAAHRGLAGTTDADVAARRQALLDELRALSRRMERMRLEVLAVNERRIQDRAPA